jgi:hypothetical protein
LAASGDPPDEYDMEYEEALYDYELYYNPEEFDDDVDEFSP